MADLETDPLAELEADRAAAQAAGIGGRPSPDPELGRSR